MIISRQIQKFIRFEAIGGVLLFIALFVALIIANSPLDQAYQRLIDMPVHIGIGQMRLEKPAILWVNEGLMAIFFMLLALEVKREFLEGELSDMSQLALPFAGAVGGIVFPILIYILFNHGHTLEMRGWPIPTTTDVAFMLGIVALLGKRVPNGLKVMLVALSIVDDIVAIIIIAVSYSHSLSWISFAIAILCIILLVLCNRYHVTSITAYVLIGVVMWVAVLQSGIHATLAGVVVGLLVPLRNPRKANDSPLRSLEHRVHPWVAYGVLPIFVLFNGGVPFAGFHMSQLLAPLPLGIALGLFVGKTVGVFICCWIVLQLKIATLPAQASYRQLLGVASLTGIGFTMSLFLSTLAFANTQYENLSRQGVLMGSLVACVFGVCVLLKKPPQQE
ncbi:MAG: Na+/H+ antiporter NhaA [Coxiella sp. (in: Bacteria)]|nr:MAG: Na+/H+ antiporter NhaA [Coxiella sp. (in: g-proteobacteria)]